VQQQNNSLKETQKQFAIDNMANLECSDFTFTEFEADKRPKILFRIINFGKSPAQVYRFRLGFFYSKTIGVSPEGYVKKLLDDPIPSGFSITNQYPRIEMFTADDIIPKAFYDEAMNNNLYMIFCGEIEYFSEVNQDRRKYVFNAILFPPPRKDYKLIYFRNINLKD
jgi:hypothetical protein